MWLGLGSNLGDRAATLRWSVGELTRRGLVIEAVSRVYETAPQGVEDQPAFLNAACRARTTLMPPDALHVAKDVEAAAGRVEGPHWGPRPLDVDILAWDGGEWSAPDLAIPHPRLRERRFALLPLVEVDPDLVLPGGDRIADLLAAIPGADQPVEATAEALPLP